mmetsp:Transcript_3808/g.7702  ORF Transcript_3808/g.7702 Transcript_3808/m.7702 type:complete len:204 (-) Transcript_3808:68-679(-)
MTQRNALSLRVAEKLTKLLIDGVSRLECLPHGAVSMLVPSLDIQSHAEPFHGALASVGLDLDRIEAPQGASHLKSILERFGLRLIAEEGEEVLVLCGLETVFHRGVSLAVHFDFHLGHGGQVPCVEILTFTEEHACVALLALVHATLKPKRNGSCGFCLFTVTVIAVLLLLLLLLLLLFLLLGLRPLFDLPDVLAGLGNGQLL